MFFYQPEPDFYSESSVSFSYINLGADFSVYRS